MSIFADLNCIPTDLVLGLLTESAPERVVRIPLVLRLEHAISCYAVFTDGGSGGVVASLRDEEAIRSVEGIDHTGNTPIVSIELPLRSGSLLGSLAKSNVELVEAAGTSEAWLFRVRCPDRDTLRAFTEHLEDRHPIRVDRVYEPTTGRTHVEPVLTPEQEAALQLAVEAGYFRVPRETSLDELSDELDVSDSAVSQRLRRGTNSVLSTMFE